MPSPKLPTKFLAGVLFVLATASLCYGQGGPPLFTDDPGTPGNRHWEINLGFTTDRRNDTKDYELPQLDVNYGAGDHVQINYQVSWIDHHEARVSKSGLGNSQFAVKWRFFENKDHAFNLSTYPRLEFNNPNNSVNRGLARRGTSFLLPLEVTKTVGPVDVNFEAGHWFQHSGPGRWIFGLAFGHQMNQRWEFLGEVYDVDSSDPGEADSTVGIGGRVKLKGPFVLLYMAGRSLRSVSSGQSSFVGYLGMQFLFPPERIAERQDPTSRPVPHAR